MLLTARLARATARSYFRPSLARHTVALTTIKYYQKRTFWGSSSAAPPTEIVNSAAEFASNSSIPSIAPELLPLVIAVLLASADENDDVPESPPPWKVSASPNGIGYGAFATRRLKRGELLIAERPICVWPQNLSAEQAKALFDQLTDKNKKIYMALAGNEETSSGGGLDPIRKIRATNGFACQVPGGKTLAMVFPTIARINHSCIPNASQAMNRQNLRMEVYPITSIEPNTEITIDYLPMITKTRAERAVMLQSSFGFSSCLCPLCTASPEVVAQSDSRRREIRRLGENLRQGRKDRKKTLENLTRIQILLKEEGYLGLPEFDDVNISNAYAVFATRPNQ